MNKIHRGNVIGTLLIVLIAFSLVAPTVASGPATPPLQASQSTKRGPLIVFYASHGEHPFRVAPPRDSSEVRVQSATINVNYIAAGMLNALGDICLAWPAGAQAAFDYATSIWGTLLNSTVPIRINACWANLGYGVLGHSAPETIHKDFPGAPVANTWYAVALANALAGTDQNDTDGDDTDGYSGDVDAEMEIAYSGNGISWYFGTDRNVPMGQYDFVSVVLHEIAHGLGFAGSMMVSGGVGSWGYGTGYPIAYDRFTENGSGQALLSFANNSTALAAQLTSNNLYFDGPNANAANGGNRPKLYAPSTWQSGSSYAHLDEVFNETVNALMTWSLDDGEAVHDPGPVTRGILQDVGWATGTSGPTVTSIMPASGVNTGTIHITNLAGTNFQSGATVKLTKASQSDINATNVAVASASQITCDFDLTAAATGQWNVVVTNLDMQSGQLTNGFIVYAPGGDHYTYLPLVINRWPPLPGTLYSVGDACILQGYPTLNFGDTVDMWAGYDDYLSPDGKIVRSLIQFNTSDIPAGTSISSAVLRVYLVGSWDYPARRRTITTYRISSAWSESSVTWNTSPSFAEAYGSASVQERAWGWYSFDITNLVRGWVNGTQSNYGVMLRGPEQSGADSSWRSFSTREGGYTPQLVISYTGYTGLTDGELANENPHTERSAGTIIEALTGGAKADSLSDSLCRPYSSINGKCLTLLP